MTFIAHKIGKHELRKLILSGPKVHEQSHTIINFEVSHSISRKKGHELMYIEEGKSLKANNLHFS